MTDEKLKWTRPRIMDLDDEDARLASGGCSEGSVENADCYSGGAAGDYCSTGGSNLAMECTFGSSHG